MKKKLCITGSTGLVMSRFVELYGRNYKVLDDIDSEGSEVIIHASAYTDVGLAENNKIDAWNVTVGKTEDIIEYCKRHKTKLIYISTDFVFSGVNGPCGESDRTVSSWYDTNWYGWTKRCAEKVIIESDIDYAIIRVSYPFKPVKDSKKLDFAHKFIKKYDDKELPSLFYDQQITPTFIDDFCNGLDLILNQNASGIFHIASEVTTPYAFAKYLLSRYRKREEELPSQSMQEYNGYTIPIFGGLNCQRIVNLGLHIHSTRDAIDILLKNEYGI